VSAVAIPFPRVTPAARVGAVVLVALLFVFSGQYDPDFEAYRLIYESGGAWLEDLGRDPAFVYIIGKLNEVMSYESFRYSLCAFFGIATWKLQPRLAEMTNSQFGAVQLLFFAPLVMLKFHVQVREGLALVLWMFAATRPNRRSILFWVAAVVSCSIHLGLVALWAALVVRRPALIFLLGAAYAVMSSNIGRELFYAAMDSQIEVRDTGFDVQITEEKIAYWTLFTVIPLLVLWMFHRSAIASPFGRIGVYGLLGFFPVAALLAAGEGEFSNVLRIAHNMLLLLTIQLALTRSTWPLTWAVGIFTIADTVRILSV
jgi:hypothetical protein